MTRLRAYVRCIIMALVMALGMVAILVISLFPRRPNRVPLTARLTNLMARAMILVFDIRLTCDDPALIRNHHGFLMANHTSYMDIVALQAIMPLRYVAKMEIKRYPVIGRIATGIGCVYVDRASKSSRTAARHALAGMERFPAVVIFPEGRSGPGGELIPFRHGGFEIALATQTDYLLCAISYDRPHITSWRGRRFGSAIWELAKRPGPIFIHIKPVGVHSPAGDDDPPALSVAAHAALTDALRGTPMIDELVSG